jgi:predicted nucleic acid-binding protein
MRQQYRIIIADTSCFILLDKISSLELLHQVFGEVITTIEVQNEFGKQLPQWIKIEAVNNVEQQSLLESEIDKGEASAIALAMEKTNSLLILDDFKARRIAEKLHLQFTGTLGVLLKAKQAGIISLLKPTLEKIQQTNFRFSEKVFEDILKAANEY